MFFPTMWWRKDKIAYAIPNIQPTQWGAAVGCARRGRNRPLRRSAGTAWRQAERALRRYGGRCGDSSIAIGISWQVLFVDFFAHGSSFRRAAVRRTHFGGAAAHLGGEILALTLHKKTPQIEPYPIIRTIKKARIGDCQGGDL